MSSSQMVDLLRKENKNEIVFVKVCNRNDNKNTKN